MNNSHGSLQSAKSKANELKVESLHSPPILKREVHKQHVQPHTRSSSGRWHHITSQQITQQQHTTPSKQGRQNTATRCLTIQLATPTQYPTPHFLSLHFSSLSTWPARSRQPVSPLVVKHHASSSPPRQLVSRHLPLVREQIDTAVSLSSFISSHCLSLVPLICLCAALRWCEEASPLPTGHCGSA